MQLSEKGSAFIREWEGLRLKLYKDAVGLPTIGYGHLLKTGETYKEIGKDKAIQIFKEDVKEFEEGVLKLVKVDLLQHEFDALVSFSFNVGLGNLKNSTLLKLLNERKFEEAAKQFVRWNRAAGKPLEGLSRRRTAESKIFTKGIYS